MRNPQLSRFLLAAGENYGVGDNYGAGENYGVGKFKSDTGSAIVEFVLLAIPLMVPLVMYLTAVRESSTINSDLHNLARQSARAFITSGYRNTGNGSG